MTAISNQSLWQLKTGDKVADYKCSISAPDGKRHFFNSIFEVHGVCRLDFSSPFLSNAFF